ncbi:MAG: hypothetical protein N5P05_000300 [Chroococcopsis gigantea SAG 12.99]|jgi:hypothetical protein|nr:hypothetical protein [Chroococcopsis gigantea SAG 12.99]
MKKPLFIFSLTVSSIFLAWGNVKTGLHAQTLNPSEPAFQKNEKETGLNGGIIDGFNPLDLIHNSNFQRRSSSDFQDDSNQEIDKAASEFKRRQLEQLQNTNNPQKPSQN